MSDSTKSGEEAISNAIEKASKSVKGIRSAYIQSQSVVVKNNKVTAYRVNLKVSLEIQ